MQRPFASVRSHQGEPVDRLVIPVDGIVLSPTLRIVSLPTDHRAFTRGPRRAFTHTNTTKSYAYQTFHVP